MYITWLGHSCFKIQDKSGSDAVTIVTDPFDKSVGLKVPRLEADIVTISHQHPDHNNIEAVKGDPFVVRDAGEYDIKGVSIVGVETYHDDKEGAQRGRNIAFWIEVDGVSVLHLGDLGAELTEKELSRLPSADILFVPVGGKYTIDAKQAVSVINQIEPRIVIPMHYKSKECKLDIDGVEKFINELGLKPAYEEKLRVTKKDLPSDEMELVVFKE
jgi:L-ascorbate metabolism protein UlaG (beta-lactamase superfamily)